jgi:hypothetical protein
VAGSRLGEVDGRGAGAHGRRLRLDNHDVPEANPRRRVELTALAIAISVVASLGVSHFHVLRLGGPPASPAQPAPPPAIVYGTGLAHAPAARR